MAKLTLKDVATVIGADNVMVVKSHQRAMKQHRLEISQVKEILDVARESIEAKLPNHIGKKEVSEINEDIRTIQTARVKLIELKNKIHHSQFVCKKIFFDAEKVLEQRKSRSGQSEIRNEIPNPREDWLSFLRKKIAEKNKSDVKVKQYTDEQLENALICLVDLLNIQHTPKISHYELEDLLRGLRRF